MTASRAMRADARRNYERILETAQQAFAEQGPDAPLDDIARRAGVGPGTLYRHFPRREALVEAVYRDSIERLGARAHELLAEVPPDRALAEWMRALVDYVIAKRGIMVTLRASLGASSPVYDACKTLLREAADALLAAGREAGTIRADVTAHDLLLLGHGLGAGCELSPEATGRLIAVTLDGLRATGDAPPP